MTVLVSNIHAWLKVLCRAASFATTGEQLHADQRLSSNLWANARRDADNLLASLPDAVLGAGVCHQVRN